MQLTEAKTREKNNTVKSPHMTNVLLRDNKPALSQEGSTLRMKRSELIVLTTQLSVMIDSGVILSDALDTISKQAQEGNFKQVVSKISENVKNGKNFSMALAEYPRVFNPMFVSMVRASEASGRMSEMLGIIGGYLEFEYETQKRVKAALTYPFIMTLVAFAATGSLMFFVLPKFTNIYEARRAALPKLTQVLVAFSRLFSDMRFLTILITIVSLSFIAFLTWIKTVQGRRTIDYLKIHFPVIGTMFVDMIVARSMKIMATMLNTGVTLLETIEVVHSSCRNYYFQRLWEWIDDKIRNGYQLSEAMQISPYNDLIAPAIIQMLRAGEKSGYLGRVSEKVSIYYEKKLENSINTATKYIEPIMILILGSIIGTIAIALLLPVFRISTVIAY